MPLVNHWCEDHVVAAVQYSHISKWNTSLVTNMKELFKMKFDFNDDISKWNVSNVADMSSMFSCYDPEDEEAVSAFDEDISGWDVSSVTNMRAMFSNCLIPEDHKPR
jgi:surface protein